LREFPSAAAEERLYGVRVPECQGYWNRRYSVNLKGRVPEQKLDILSVLE